MELTTIVYLLVTGEIILAGCLFITVCLLGKMSAMHEKLVADLAQHGIYGG